MRNLAELLATQVIDESRLGEAVELKTTMDNLREENERLKRECDKWKTREGEISEELEERDEALAAAKAVNELLKKELHDAEVSLDALFLDLETAKKRIKQLEGEKAAKKKQGTSQADLLASSVEKQANTATPIGFLANMGGSSSAMQRKIGNLEKENQRLKSEVVCLRSQLREVEYENRKRLEDGDYSSTQPTSCESSSLSSNEEGPSSLTSPRTMVGRDLRVTSTAPSSSRKPSGSTIEGLKEGIIPSRRSRPPPEDDGFSETLTSPRRVNSLPLGSFLSPVQSDRRGSQRIGGLRKMGLPLDARDMDRSDHAKDVRAPRRINSLPPTAAEHNGGENEDESALSLFTRSMHSSMRWFKE